MKKTSSIIWSLVIVLAMQVSPAFAKDKDSNPPGPAGGKGTNWENPPGPTGGQGASPDRKGYGRDRKADRNHDGIVDAAERAKRQEVIAELKEKRDEARETAEAAAASTPVIYDPADSNHDGTVDDFEKKQAMDRGIIHWDKDNNPPGPIGGVGTNWENPPGPVGGLGTSPDKRRVYHHDKDNNPPGPTGGKGTNWENPPGPAGGKGASADRRH